MKKENNSDSDWRKRLKDDFDKNPGKSSPEQKKTIQWLIENAKRVDRGVNPKISLGEKQMKDITGGNLETLATISNYSPIPTSILNGPFKIDKTLFDVNGVLHGAFFKNMDRRFLGTSVGEYFMQGVDKISRKSQGTMEKMYRMYSPEKNVQENLNKMYGTISMKEFNFANFVGGVKYRDVFQEQPNILDDRKIFDEEIISKRKFHQLNEELIEERERNRKIFTENTKLEKKLAETKDELTETKKDNKVMREQLGKAINRSEQLEDENNRLRGILAKPQEMVEIRGFRHHPLS